MLTNKFYKYPIMILMLAVIGFACSDSNNNSDSATVNGSVEQSQAKAKTLTEGTVVTMATVTANGSINTIEGAETTTETTGEEFVPVVITENMVERALQQNEGATRDQVISSLEQRGHDVSNVK